MDSNKGGNNRDLSGLRHDMRQPLNVIAMVAANIRSRASQDFASLDEAYLLTKLDRIDKKLIELEGMIERL